jgi:hypothetical protein
MRKGKIMTTRTDQLTRALLDMAARGERSHCSDPASHHLWLSDHERERQTAIMLCDHCPVLTVCRDTAELRDERWAFGVAATSAADPVERRSRHPNRKRPTTGGCAFISAAAGSL